MVTQITVQGNGTGKPSYGPNGLIGPDPVTYPHMRRNAIRASVQMTVGTVVDGVGREERRGASWYLESCAKLISVNDNQISILQQQNRILV